MSISPLLVYGFVWIRVPRKVFQLNPPWKSLEPFPTSRTSCLWWFCIHEVWIQEIIVHVKTCLSFLDLTWMQIAFKNLERDNLDKRNSEKLKLGCEKTHEAQRDILTTIDFLCAGWLMSLTSLEKRMHPPLNFSLFPHVFFDFCGIFGFEKQISSQHRRGGQGRHRPRWSCSMAPASPNDQRPKCRTSAGPNLFVLGESAMDAFLWISCISHVLKLRGKQNHQMIFDNSGRTFLGSTYNDAFIVCKLAPSFEFIIKNAIPTYKWGKM